MTPASPSARDSLVAGLLGFASFWVFPAIPIGTSTAIDFPSLLGVLVLVGSLGGLRVADARAFLLLVAPLCGSLLLWAMTGGALSPEVLPRATFGWAFGFLTLVPAGLLVRRGHSRMLLVGAWIAIPIHAVLGVYQAIAFGEGEFPFLALMATNPGMAMPAEIADNYAEYVRRPFGLFAEPSAMAACVGPWLVVAAGVLLVPSMKARFERDRVLALVALCSGTLLLVLSRSGQAAIVIAALAALAALAMVSSLGRTDSGARRRRVWMSAAFAVLAVFAMWALVSSMESGLENTSWEGRAASLLLALDSLTGSVFVFFAGMGPGQSFAQMQGVLGALLPVGQNSVSSVTLTYLMETGFLGAAALAVIGLRVARRIRESRARLDGWFSAGVWFAGVTLATSYPQQPSLWVFLAILLNWNVTVGDDKNGGASSEKGAVALGPE